MHQRFAPHELLELHELLSHETVCAQKGSIFGQSLVDNDIRNFAQKCMSMRQKRIQDCQAIMGHTGSFAAGQTWGTDWGNTGQHGYDSQRFQSSPSGSYYDFDKKH